MTLSLPRFLGVIAAAGGLLAAFGGSPYRSHHATLDVERAALAVAHEEDHVTAVELAEWIRDRKPGLRVIDLRGDSEYQSYHLPTAERVPIDALPQAQFRLDETIVLVSDGGTHAAQGWVFLQALGYRHVNFLRGGMGEWLDDVMNPVVAADAGPAARASFQRARAVSRYFGGAPRVVDKGSEGDSRVPEARPKDDLTGSRPPAAVTDTASKVKEIRRRGC